MLTCIKNCKKRIKIDRNIENVWELKRKKKEIYIKKCKTVVRTKISIEKK